MSPFDAMSDLNRRYAQAALMRYAGTYGGIKALVGMVESGERTAEEIMPAIQEAIADHEREHEQVWADHRRQLDALRVQANAYIDRLRAEIVLHEQRQAELAGGSA